MADLTILGERTQHLDHVWNLTVLHTDAGDRAACVGDVTFSIYAPYTNGKWWDAVTAAWVDDRTENTMTADPLVGLYTAAVDPQELAGDLVTELDVLVFVICDDALETSAQVHLRHSPDSLPVTVQTLSAAPATAGELRTALAADVGGSIVLDDETKHQVVSVNGVTVLEHILTDAAGNPSVMEPFNRLEIA